MHMRQCHIYKDSLLHSRASLSEVYGSINVYQTAKDNSNNYLHDSRSVVFVCGKVSTDYNDVFLIFMSWQWGYLDIVSNCA